MLVAEDAAECEASQNRTQLLPRQTSTVSVGEANVANCLKIHFDAMEN